MARRYPDRLKIELNALATEVLFDERNCAIGVAYLKGAKLYRAVLRSGDRRPGTPQKAYAAKEVILSGGAFNTPQLLMLSGIGPKEDLEALGIKTRVNLQGVGKNLQDRYEVGVVNRLKKPWSVLKGATFTTGDPQYKHWNSWWRKGVYTTNGAAIAVINRSQVSRPVPDLFMFALLGKFKGYFPGYSKADRRQSRRADLVHSQGAHGKPRRHRQAALQRTRSIRRRSTSIISRKAPTRTATISLRWSTASSSSAR